MSMNRRHILVIEDDEGIRETLKDVLELDGYEVSTAANGLEALSLLERGDPPPCLIFLDLMMPVMNGWEFLEAIRNRTGREADIPVVVVSAAADVADAGGRFGCRVMKKPPDIDHLLDTARRYCAA